jgi:hypothetical protein
MQRTGGQLPGAMRGCVRAEGESRACKIGHVVQWVSLAVHTALLGAFSAAICSTASCSRAMDLLDLEKVSSRGGRPCART